jgi:NAD(P)-dependent dehydrogenase (short-subunit alcohol dehydrogenase family)
MGRVLCIGATGMLAGCVQELLARGDQVDCIARTSSSLNSLKDSLPTSQCPRLGLHACDYRDLDGFRKTLESIKPAPDAAICWVHSPTEPVLDLVRSIFPGLDLLWVVGSATRAPGQAVTPGTRIARLGFRIEGDRSRWLTHQEIARGVLEAFISGAEQTTVGEIEPWDRRPGQSSGS